jgi:hypothetical protein
LIGDYFNYDMTERFILPIFKIFFLLITSVGLKKYFQNLEKLAFADYVFIISSSSLIFGIVFLLLKSIKQPDYSFTPDHFYKLVFILICCFGGAQLFLLFIQCYGH